MGAEVDGLLADATDDRGGAVFWRLRHPLVRSHLLFHPIEPCLGLGIGGGRPGFSFLADYDEDLSHGQCFSFAGAVMKDDSSIG